MSVDPMSEHDLPAKGVRSFVPSEPRPREQVVEKLGEAPDELFRDVRKKAIKAGYCAPNMPTEHGGGVSSRGRRARRAGARRRLCELEARSVTTARNCEGPRR